MATRTETPRALPKYVYPDAPPRILRHRGCGGEFSDRRICERCGAELGPRDSVAEPPLAPLAI